MLTSNLTVGLNPCARATSSWDQQRGLIACAVCEGEQGMQWLKWFPSRCLTEGPLKQGGHLRNAQALKLGGKNHDCWTPRLQILERIYSFRNADNLFSQNLYLSLFGGGWIFCLFSFKFQLFSFLFLLTFHFQYFAFWFSSFSLICSFLWLFPNTVSFYSSIGSPISLFSLSHLPLINFPNFIFLILQFHTSHVSQV